jgi:DNA polymerase elongation subunit (family B)
MILEEKFKGLRCPHRHKWPEHKSCFLNGRIKNIEKKTPKILLFDIETLPMSVFVWGLYKQRISPDNVISDSCILSWSAKWLFSSEIYSDCLTSREATDKDDTRLIAKIWDLLNSADIVIAHNANGYDIKKLNTRFLVHGFPPPKHYQVIDTLSVLRKNFKISSNSLDYATKFLGLTEKQHPSFDLWKRCYQGDKSAIQEMVSYNQNDVSILEELYVRIRPWITGHPNLGLYVDTNTSVCPNCGSENLKWEGSYVTQCGRYKAFRCECGAIGRSRINEMPKNKLLVRS